MGGVFFVCFGDTFVNKGSSTLSNRGFSLGGFSFLLWGFFDASKLFRDPLWGVDLFREVEEPEKSSSSPLEAPKRSPFDVSVFGGRSFLFFFECGAVMTSPNKLSSLASSNNNFDFEGFDWLIFELEEV